MYTNKVSTLSESCLVYAAWIHAAIVRALIFSDFVRINDVSHVVAGLHKHIVVVTTNHE